MAEEKQPPGSSEDEAPKRPRRKIRIKRTSAEIAEQEQQLHERIQAFRESLFHATPHVIFTPGIVALNVIIFVYMVLKGVGLFSPQAGQLVEWGANFGPYTMSGDGWRLVTSMFLHIGLIHLAFNMWVLWDLGHIVERMLGPVGFVFLYMLSGVAGSTASILWNPRVVSAGASGAVFGVFGAMMAFLVMRRDSIPKEILYSLRNSGLMFLGVNVLFGLSVKGIDNAAHFGGLGMGFLLGLALSQPLTQEPGIRTRLLLRGLLVGLVASGVVGFGVHSYLSGPRADRAQLLRVYSKVVRHVAKAEKSVDAIEKLRTLKKIRLKAYLRRMRKEAIPLWKRAGAEIDKALRSPKLNDKSQKALGVVRNYTRLSLESVELWVKGIETTNPAQLRAAKAKKMQAEKLVPQIQKWMRR